MSFKRDENGKYVATANFKMPKSVKRVLATITDKEMRNHWKNVNAQGIMSSFDVPVKSKKNATGKVEVAV